MMAMRQRPGGAAAILDLSDDTPPAVAAAMAAAADTLEAASACQPVPGGGPAAVKTGVPVARFPSTATTADSMQPARPHSPGSPESASTVLLDLTASAAAAASDGTVPLFPPPEACEGTEAAAEYAVYLKRWAAGSTLHQRFQR